MNDQSNQSGVMTPGGADGAIYRARTVDPTESRVVRRFAEKSTLFPPADGEKLAGTAQAQVYKSDHGNAFARFAAMPRVRRVSMVPSPLDRRALGWLWRRIAKRGETPTGERGGDAGRSPPAAATNGGAREAAWSHTARRRRIILSLLVLAQTALATWSLARTFPHPELSGLQTAILATFAVLFSWISFSFWSGIAGFCTLWRKAKYVSAENLSAGSDRRRLRSRTAVAVPICDEEVRRVFAGVEACCRSLADTGQLEKFDFYILSDTQDAEKHVEEEIAWGQLCQAADGFGRIFYRHRRVNIKRKSGNIADFLRRWGRNYDFMIVLDADSIMAGKTLVRLARLMEDHPRAGIIQTAPTIVNRDSLFARAAVRQPRLRPDVQRQPAFLAARRELLLGTQRDSAHRAFHQTLRTFSASRRAAAGRRNPEPRFCGGGTDGADGLGGLVGL